MTTSLIDSLLRDAIGFDSLARFGLNVQPTNKYPPHNIIKVADDEYNLVLAVAGFSREELVVSLVGNELTVKGEKSRNEGPGKHVEYLYQGLALRDFERVWKLEDGIEVEGVRLLDGLLIVSLTRKVEKPSRTNFSIR
jgi:molecular chaperone IbpA